MLSLPDTKDQISFSFIKKFSPKKNANAQAILDSKIVDLSLYVRDIFYLFLMSDSEDLLRDSPSLVTYGNHKENNPSSGGTTETGKLWLKRDIASRIRSLYDHPWRSVPVHEVVRRIVGLSPIAYSRIVFFPVSESSNQPDHLRTNAPGEVINQFEWYAVVHKVLVAFDLASLFWGFSSFKSNQTHLFATVASPAPAVNIYLTKVSELLKTGKISSDVFNFFVNEIDLNQMYIQRTGLLNPGLRASYYQDTNKIGPSPMSCEGLNTSHVYTELEYLQTYIDDFEDRVRKNNNQVDVIKELYLFNNFVDDKAKPALRQSLLANWLSTEFFGGTYINRYKFKCVDDMPHSAVSCLPLAWSSPKITHSKNFPYSTIALNLLFNTSGFLDYSLIEELHADKLQQQKILAQTLSLVSPNKNPNSAALVPFSSLPDRLTNLNDLNLRKYKNQNGFNNIYSEDSNLTLSTPVSRSFIYAHQMCWMASMNRTPSVAFVLEVEGANYEFNLHEIHERLGIEAKQAILESGRLTGLEYTTPFDPHDTTFNLTSGDGTTPITLQTIGFGFFPPQKVEAKESKEKLKNKMIAAIRRAGFETHKTPHSRMHFDNFLQAMSFIDPTNLKFWPITTESSID
jgi:hypothetical protein